MKGGTKIKRDEDDTKSGSNGCKYCGKQHKGECMKRNNTCFNYGLIGHLAIACKKPRTNRYFKCKKEGHFAKECPQKEDKSREEKEISGSAGMQPRNRAIARTFNMSVHDALEADDVITEMIEDDFVITKARTYVKKPEDFTPAEKEEAFLDASLQLILVDSLDPLMNRHVMNYKNSKHIWETIEVINEDTEEVRENKLEILTSEYEHFKSNPGEGITEVFERYNALINNLNINGKYYSFREVNKKFLLTLPTHLEHRITAIREARDLSEISLERLYDVLKTYELEQIQQKEVYGKGRVVNTSTALVAEGQQQQQHQQQQ
ncbi:hypothetical protein AgCh_032511 [Apium graveolens]